MRFTLVWTTARIAPPSTVITARTQITVLGGAILAVVQTNVKRMLAYSSISHAGFILVGVDAAGRLGGNGDDRARRPCSSTCSPTR